jgi:hypothetical protein
MLKAMARGRATTPTVKPATQSFPNRGQLYPSPEDFKKSSKLRGIKSRMDTNLFAVIPSILIKPPRKNQ